jgi:hypothetical protein
MSTYNWEFEQKKLVNSIEIFRDAAEEHLSPAVAVNPVAQRENFFQAGNIFKRHELPQAG